MAGIAEVYTTLPVGADSVLMSIVRCPKRLYDISIFLAARTTSLELDVSALTHENPGGYVT